MDWSNNLCLRCNKGGKLLICSGCPLAMHKGCMNCLANVNEMGNFWCPHCSYKQAVAELRQTRKHVDLKRKALSIFLGIDCGEDSIQNNEAEARRVYQLEIGIANVSVGASSEIKHRRKENTILNQSVRLNHVEENRLQEKENMSMSSGYDKRVQKISYILNQPLQLNEEGELRNADEGDKIQVPGTSSVSTQAANQPMDKEEGMTRKKNSETYEVYTDKDPSDKINARQKINSSGEDQIQEEDGGRSLASNHRYPSPTVPVSTKRRIEVNDFLNQDSRVLTRSTSVPKKHVEQVDNNDKTSPAVNSANILTRGSPSSTHINNSVSDEECEWRDPKHQSVKPTSGTPGSGRYRRVLWIGQRKRRRC